MNLVAFHQTQDPISEENMPPALGRTSIGMGIAGTLQAAGGGRGWRVDAEGAAEGHLAVAYALRRDPGGTGQGHNTNYAPTAQGIRRLTPRECERLQGFPDDWTRITPDTPDSRRYAAMGDAVTVPVARWIGERLARYADG